MIKEGYLRVTDVLKPFSELRNVPEDILKRAAERGSLVHNTIEEIINGFDPEDIGIHQPYIDSFNKWNLGIQHVKRPERFYCDGYKITGECDSIIKEQDGLTLIDFKTSAKESKTWPLQGSAYAYLAITSGIIINKIVFVKLNKYGDFPEIFEYKEDFSLFLDCLRIYRQFFKEENMINIEDI